jgi:membrane-associated phospholipid phosphatase
MKPDQCYGIGSTLRRWRRYLCRPARSEGLRPQRRPVRLMLSLGLGIAGVVVTALVLDGRIIAWVRHLPGGLIAVFDGITDYGKSGWLLVPLAAALVVLACAPSITPALRFRLIAPLTVRIGFLFIAIAAPGALTLVIKQLIGRTRPYAADGDIYVLAPLTLQAANASFPSGHSTTAFAAALAISALWPSAQWIAWSYALVIGISRIIVTAHFPSDVLASAVIGILGALLVRDYFAARRLGFAVLPDGSIRALPGPSAHHLRNAASAWLSHMKIQQ